MLIVEHRLWMAPRRLSDSEKQDIVARYRDGESTIALADAFGCSPNTISRTVKALIPADEYSALKISRQRGSTTSPSDLSQSEQTPPEQTPLEQAQSDEPAGASASSITAETHDPDPESDTPPEDSLVVVEVAEEEDPSSLALDDADDFGVDPEDESEDDTKEEEDMASPSQNAFQELVPLTDVSVFEDRDHLDPLPLSPDVLPDSVYMLVDKVVELDARPLKEFAELGRLDDSEGERNGLYLFTSPRTAKRQCGRSQRVIKVPDTAVFRRTSSYLLARGITRLVMDGTVIALDHEL